MKLGGLNQETRLYPCPPPPLSPGPLKRGKREKIQAKKIDSESQGSDMSAEALENRQEGKGIKKIKT